MIGSQTTISGRSTLADLIKEPGKAELIGGRIVRFMPTGYRPNRIAFQIAKSLDSHAIATGQGTVVTDGMGFTVLELTSGRESFSPDAAYYDGPLPTDKMGFVPGPPTFAVEVRSKSDLSPGGLAAMADKRVDYFEAGTRVVWDVDPVAEVIYSYRADAPEVPVTFIVGDEANAEPAVPGWRVTVNELFGH